MLKTKSPVLAMVLTMLVFLTGCCCLGSLSLYFSAGDHGLPLFFWYFSQPMVIVLNLIPFVLLGLLLLALVGRAWLAFLLDGAVCLFFSWAQYWKLMARSDPIYAEDLLIFTEATQMAGQYIQITWQIVLSAVLVLAGAAVLFFLFRARMRHPGPRVALAAAIIALSCWLYPNVYIDASTYNGMIVWPQVNQWFEANQYISRGGIYPFIHSVPNALPTPPEGYDKDATAADLAGFPSDNIPQDQQVSIIVTQLEAFADLSGLTDRITGADPYAEYHAILSESYSGRLIPDVFAGGTIFTERSVLTGFSSLENFRRPSWSYARYFAEQGYTLDGSHAGYEAFYNRLNVNANLGIADYRFIEGYYDALVPGIPLDAFYLKDVTDTCLRKMENGPLFSFNVTYQNHGPYYTDRANFTEIYVPQEELSSSDFYIINNYLWGIQDTARQVQAMIDAFRASDKPVVLMFFGDHKPWLGEQSVTYDALGIDIRSQADESFYNYYTTDYIIWANDAARKVLNNDFVGTGPDISPCFLMNVLFDQCGWEGPGYLKLSNELMAQTPLVHMTGRYLSDGSLTNSITESQSDLLTRFLHTQYYLSMDAGGEHP